MGTLDQLVGLSDDLGKVDAYVEQVTKKLASYMNDIMEEQKDKVQENLTANGVDLATYVTRFQWDMAKFPIKQSLKSLQEMLAKLIGNIEAELKLKSQAYNQLKTSLQSMEKKQGGSLMTRNLGGIVKEEHFVLGSEYMTTLIVVVPLAMINDWHTKYENLTDMIVPRSTQIIFQDQEHALCTVTLFTKVVDEFKHKVLKSWLKGNRVYVKAFCCRQEKTSSWCGTLFTIRRN